MKKVKITAVRRTEYPDLMAKYENPIEHPCEVEEGMVWVSENGEKPEGFCNSAWEGISCNDGFRPVSYYLEALEENV